MANSIADAEKTASADKVVLLRDGGALRGRRDRKRRFSGAYL
jgi:hypothetical protein